MRISVSSGSGGALQIGFKTDVRTRLNFIGLDGTPFEGQKFTAVDLGGTYMASKKVTGFTYDNTEYTVLIDESYVAGSGVIGMILPPPYDSAFPTSENSWVVGKIG